MKQLTLASLTILSMSLAACGGGGTGGTSIASAPPPIVASPSVAPAPGVTSTIQSPATRAGTYDTIALIDHGGPIPGPSTDRLAAPGEVRITTYQSTANANELSYTLQFASAELPGGKSTLTAVFPPKVLNGPSGQIIEKFGDRFSTGNGGGDRSSDHSNVTSTSLGGGKTLYSYLEYSTGLSYVSLGQWNWGVTDDATGNTEEFNSAYFVNGDRTPAGNLPVSGSATYTGASLGFSTDAGDRGSAYGTPIDVALAADFAKQSIAAQLSRAFASTGDSVGGFISVAAVDLHGVGVITALGTFAIPLTGTISTTPVTGSLDGAFFGPNATQVGGVFTVGQVPGVPLVRDAFVGFKN